MIIKTKPDEIQSYLADAANFKGCCSAVYFPESHQDLIEVIKSANKNKTEITIAGNRTGLTGSGIPINGILISTEKLNRVIEINRENKFAIVQPGVLLSEFQKLAGDYNLLYPPDPTENNCFIGGTIATNASGSKSFKYGPTRNYVKELKVILPDGDELHLIRGTCFAETNKLNLKTGSGREIQIELPDYKMPLTKNASGYYCSPNMDAIDLFIGSEGTLGVFSEIKIDLIDAPENILSSVIFFTNENDALNFIDELRDLSIANENDPENICALGLEFFDIHSLNILRTNFQKIPLEASAAVWLEHETNSINEEKILNEIIQIIISNNGNTEASWFAMNSTERDVFKDFRHAVSWKVSEYIAKHNVMKVGTDSAVSIKHFRMFYDYIKGLAKNSGIDYLIYGHFGDCHVHLNLLPKNDGAYEYAKEVYLLICRKAIELNGTISAEHGIGKLKHNYLMMMYGEKAIKQMAAIKLLFDPNKIMGIGNIFNSKYLNI